jgi:hypothetical protein
MAPKDNNRNDSKSVDLWGQIGELWTVRRTLHSRSWHGLSLKTQAFLATQLQCSDQRYRYALNVALSTVLVQILNMYSPTSYWTLDRAVQAPLTPKVTTPWDLVITLQGGFRRQSGYSEKCRASQTWATYFSALKMGCVLSETLVPAPTNLPTYSIEQSTSWDANRFSSSQEISRIL